MLTCKEAARLLAESLDHPLPFWRRVSLKLHVWMCRLCRQFGDDLRYLHHQLHEQPDEAEEALLRQMPALPERTRERLEQALKQRGA